MALLNERKSLKIKIKICTKNFKIKHAIQCKQIPKFTSLRVILNDSFSIPTSNQELHASSVRYASNDVFMNPTSTQQLIEVHVSFTKHVTESEIGAISTSI